jgi:hypothetical protein
VETHVVVDGDVFFILSSLSSSQSTYFYAIVASPLSQRYYSLHCLSPKLQIDFDSRLGIHDVGNDCLMLVDGTDFRIPQKGFAKKGNPFGSHKYAGKSALRYELGIDILMGNLMWIQGPYPAGAWPNIKIFTSCLAHFLEPYECIEADDGYREHADKVKCPKNDVNPVKNLKMQGHVRACHETLNRRLKNWGILSQVFRHDIGRHGDVFWACAVITQLTIEHGEPLFAVE